MNGPLVLVGCGKMGGAMLAGWLEQGISRTDIHAVEPSAPLADEIRARHGVNVVSAMDELAANLAPAFVIFAVKPQMMDDVAPAYARFVQPNTVFLSIAAGKPIAYFENHLGIEAAIVRAMPNTPAAVGRGITVACANGHVSEDQRQMANTLLEAVGEATWVDDEDLLDAVTALSGGGPAYVFLLTEVMTEAGIEAGLPEDLAARLARATVAGSGELLRQATETPDVLRQNVTSPGGTTAEALRILMAEDGWQPLMTRAIAAATARSKELAG